MELTREIYWNIGIGALLPMYIMSAISVAVLIYGLIQSLRILSLGKPLDRSQSFWCRLTNAKTMALLQTKVRMGSNAGKVHSLFFWGFTLLFLGTVLIFLQADIFEPLFGIRFLQGTFYLIFSLALDLGGLVATLMLLGFAVRRYIQKPKGMVTKDTDLLVLALLFAIMITGFLIEGLRMAVTEYGVQPELASFSPVGNMIASYLYSLSEIELRQMHAAVWWLHFVMVMAFFALIPFSRLKHLILIPVNYFYTDLGPKGKLKTLNLEDETQTSFGAAKVGDFTWKDLFDTEACLSCSRCQNLCPAYNTGKPLSPMNLIQDINAQAQENPAGNLIERITPEVLWSCTTCRACQSNCPAGVEHVPKIVEMRRNLVLMEGQLPGDEVGQALNQMEVNFNPMGMGFAGRADWAAELGIQPLSENKEVDLLYFVGCYGSFDKRNQEVARNFVKLCQAAGIKVGILGKEEKCCGEPARKLGNEYLYQTLASENAQKIQDYGVQQIITTCPHCFDTLGKQYADFGLQVKVQHYAKYLDELVTSGKLNIGYEPFAATYHDSCYIGRYNDTYEEPRHLLASIGGKVKEMASCGEQSFCCGGGGGLALKEEKIGQRINQARVQQALDTHQPTLVSNCPFCLTMLEDGIKGLEAEEKIKARDLSELLLERLKSKSESKEDHEDIGVH